MISSAGFTLASMAVLGCGGDDGPVDDTEPADVSDDPSDSDTGDVDVDAMEPDSPDAPDGRGARW